MLVADIMTAVRDLVTVSVDAQLQRYIALAVHEYNRYQPLGAKSDIVTVAAQYQYTLPTGCIQVDDVIWYPAGNLAEDEALLPDVSMPVSAPSDIANRLIDEINTSSINMSRRGAWEYTNGKLWLYPTPDTAGQTVTVYYRTGHVISGTGATLGYATIPDSHFEAIVKFSTSFVLQAQATTRANQFDYSEGLSKIVKGHMPKNLSDLANQLRFEAIALI